MKKIKNKFFLTICSVLLIVFFVDDFAIDTFADDYAGEPYIIVDSYEVSGGSVAIGNQATLTVVLANPSESLTARSVMVNISTSSGVYMVYPNIPQTYIGDIAPLEKKTISFDFEVSADYYYSKADFYITISSETRSNYVVATAPIKSDDRVITAISNNIPNQIIAGESVSISVYLKSLSSDNLRNVVMNVFADGENISSSPIGTLYSEATKTQNASFVISEVGTHSLRIEVDCMDVEGKSHTNEIYTGSIKAVDENGENIVVEPSTSYQSGYSKKDMLIMLSCGVGVLILIAGIVFVAKKNK